MDTHPPLAEEKLGVDINDLGCATAMSDPDFLCGFLIVEVKYTNNQPYILAYDRQFPAPPSRYM